MDIAIYGVMPKQDHGLITRVDLTDVPGGVIVRKYEEGWMPGTPAVEGYLVEGKTAAELIESVNQKKWTVRRWHGGARMWMGEPIPVRGPNEIRSMRRRFQKSRTYNTLSKDVDLYYTNFAFDF